MLTNDQKATICTRYLEGESLDVLRKAYKVGLPVIYAVLREGHVEVRSHGYRGTFPKWKWYGIFVQYLSGDSAQWIADTNGVSKRTIDKILDEVKKNRQHYHKMWIEAQETKKRHEQYEQDRPNQDE